LIPSTKLKLSLLEKYKKILSVLLELKLIEADVIHRIYLVVVNELTVTPKHEKSLIGEVWVNGFCWVYPNFV